MQTYLAVTPDNLDAALRCTNRIAHVAYRIDREGGLACCQLPQQVKGGMMVLSDGDGCQIGDPARLCGEIWHECAARSFGGIVADFEQPFSEERCALLNQLCTILRRNGRNLFVPECYGGEVHRAMVLICTAVSGGTLRHRLEEARGRFGERVALDLQRVRMEFPLPCPGGEGVAMKRETLEQLLSEEPAVFFSEDLCAKYFMRICGCEPRFVMFDDAQTLRRKLHLAQSMGITTAFVMYPEVEDILDELWKKNTQ